MKLYIDGGYRSSTNYGACGVLVIDNKQKKVIVRKFKDTTNNRMELLAFITAIEHLNKEMPEGKPIIFADSQYLITGIKEWLPKWKNNGYKTTRDKPIKNLDLWLKIDKLLTDMSFEYSLEWLEGHKENGTEHNDNHNKIDQILSDILEQD